MSTKNNGKNKNKNKGADIMGFDDVAVKGKGKNGPTTYEIEDSIKIEMELEDLSKHLFDTTDDAGDDSFIKAALANGLDKDRMLAVIVYDVTKEIITKAINGEEIIKKDMSKMIVSRAMTALSKDEEFKKKVKSAEDKKKFKAQITAFIETEEFDKEMDRMIDALGELQTEKGKADDKAKESDDSSVFLVTKLKTEEVNDKKEEPKSVEVVKEEPKAIEEEPKVIKPVILPRRMSQRPLYDVMKPLVKRPETMQDKPFSSSTIIERRNAIKMPC